MAIFEIKIRNFMKDGRLENTEEEVYSIPLSESIHGDEYLFEEPKVKSEMGKTGSFEFTFYPNHPLYDSLLQMKTMFRVTYFGTTIFYGRVLTIDFDSMSFKKSVHCEGYMAFLMDSLVRGLPEKNRTEKSASDYITWLITNHNNMLNRSNVYPVKYFDIGLVPGTYTPNIEVMQRPLVEGTKRFGSSSWQNTADALGELTKEYGGFFRTRYEELQDKVYLDWLCCYFGGSSSDPSKWSDRKVEVKKNIISISSSTEVDNLFTVLIPIGKKESNGKGDDSGDNLYLDELYLYVNDIIDHYSLDQLNAGFHSAQDYVDSINRYGLIYKSVNFSNATTQEQLRSWAWDYIKNNYRGENISFTISAVDMRVVDGISDPLLPGDKVVVHYAIGNGQFDDKNLVIISAEWDLHNPDKNSYTIGIPDKDFQKTYGKSSDKNKKGGKGSSGGGPSPNNEGEDDDNKNEQRYFFKEHVLSAADNSEEYRSYREKYGDDAASSILYTSDMVLSSAFNENDPSSEAIVRKLILDGKDGSITGYTAPVVANPKRRLALDTFKTITIDAFNATFSINERRDIALREAYAQHGQGSWNQFVQKAVNYNQAPHKVLEVGMESVREENETQQYLRFKTKKTGSHPSTLDEEVGKLIFTDNTTSVIDGENGTVTTASVKLAGVENDLVEKVSEQTAGYQSSISLDGEAKLIETNATNTVAPNQSSTSYVIDGKTGKSAGTEVSLVSGIGDPVKKIKEKVEGFMPTIDLSGPQAKVTTSADNTQTNFEINAKDTDGQGNTIPTVSMGPVNNPGQTTRKWSITLNKPYTYTYTTQDPSNPDQTITKTFTVPDHSIDVDDIHFTNTFDSVKAKIAVVDQLIANNIDANTITSMKATIDAITGTTIHADRRISAGTVNASNGNIDSLTSNSIGIVISGGNTINVGNSLLSNLIRIGTYRFVKSGNTVTLKGTTFGGEIKDLASFTLSSSSGGNNGGGGADSDPSAG